MLSGTLGSKPHASLLIFVSFDLPVSFAPILLLLLAAALRLLKAPLLLAALLLLEAPTLLLILRLAAPLLLLLMLLLAPTLLRLAPTLHVGLPLGLGLLERFALRRKLSIKLLFPLGSKPLLLRQLTLALCFGFFRVCLGFRGGCRFLRHLRGARRLLGRLVLAPRFLLIILIFIHLLSVMPGAPQRIVRGFPLWSRNLGVYCIDTIIKVKLQPK